MNSSHEERAAMAASTRAANVCQTCKARKKKCDKALPHCGYCTDKGLQCQYPTRHASPNTLRSLNVPYSNPNIDLLAQTPLGDTLPPVDITLCRQAQHIISATGQYLDEVSVRYFQSVHSYLPMVSRMRFHAQLLSFGASPQAGFAMLLLSMSLLTCHPSPDRPETTHLDVSTLYLAAKSLLCQAQTLCPPSLNLIQAGVLLAVFEYTCTEPEQAFLTIGVSTRMAYGAAVKRPTSLPTDVSTDSAMQLEDEQRNTWWAILICERMFLCELSDLTQPLLSVIPGYINPKKDDLNITPSGNPVLSGFQNAAQATCLLDRVIHRISDIESDHKRAELDELDRTLRTFLTAMMHQFPAVTGGKCGAIAVAIRALFLIHRQILGHRTEYDGVWYTSRAALETISKIVVDIASSHQGLCTSQLDTLPPSCIYIVRAALGHLKETDRGLVADLSFSDAESHLQHSLDRFSDRWKMGNRAPK
ncbi:hypothetical protein BDV12DRAFT_177661 [Aspergillus spectabilis]